MIDTAGPATQCMQVFLGRRYGTTVAGVVSTDAGTAYSIDPGKGAAQVTPGQVLIEGSGGIAGTVVLVVRRQLSRMAARIGQRIVGAILSRLVSVVAGGIGLVLIAKDIWDFRHGVLPIVADEMKSRATKDKVRDEIAKTISEHINDSLKEIADKTAERVVEIWQEFRRAHAKVVELADRDEAFKRFLDSIKPADLSRLDEVVAMVLASEGEAGLMRRLADGTLNHAIAGLPPAALDIARETRSLEVALKWSAIAGDSLPQIVDYEVYRRTTPDDLHQGRAAAAARPAGPARRDAAGRPGAGGTRGPARARAPGAGQARAQPRRGPAREPVALSERAGQGSAQRVLSVVAQTPARMAELSSPRVREAIIASRDQAAALGMMLQVCSLPDPGTVMAHVQLVLDGRVSPLLLWEKDGLVLGSAALLALMLLLILKRLMFGTRPRVVVQHVTSRGGHGG